MSRYQLPPDPKCGHKRKGYVTSGGAGGPHAATNACDRPACIADAMEWATATTGLPASYVTDEPRLSDHA